MTSIVDRSVDLTRRAFARYGEDASLEMSVGTGWETALPCRAIPYRVQNPSEIFGAVDQNNKILLLQAEGFTPSRTPDHRDRLTWKGQTHSIENWDTETYSVLGTTLMYMVKIRG